MSAATTIKGKRAKLRMWGRRKKRLGRLTVWRNAEPALVDPVPAVDNDPVQTLAKD